ncbi:MAG: 1-acyl-sn-glycerol-3-phosphate acyltransferase [Alphaproteobacteria bacterium]|nr:1-acyl-sn-glycerol-3-phosphate acyltransferase [Alphaproteobacteria bacterium]
MSTPQAGARARPGFAGWALIVLRSLSLVLWLLLMLPVFAPFKILTPRNPIPRLFFIGVNHILGLRIVLRGVRLRRGVFLIANHVSWLDIPALGAVTGTAFIANDGLAAHGWLQWLCRLNDTVFVARHDRASVKRQVEQVREAIGENGALTIFAEGGTSDGSAVLPFKSSLLSALTPVPARVAVHPVLLDYGRDTASIAWVGEEHGGHSYLKIAARWRPLRMTVHLLPALAEADLADRKRIAAAAHAALSRLRG